MVDNNNMNDLEQLLEDLGRPKSVAPTKKARSSVVNLNELEALMVDLAETPPPRSTSKLSVGVSASAAAPAAPVHKPPPTRLSVAPSFEADDLDSIMDALNGDIDTSSQSYGYNGSAASAPPAVVPPAPVVKPVSPPPARASTRVTSTAPSTTTIDELEDLLNGLEDTRASVRLSNKPAPPPTAQATFGGSRLNVAASAPQSNNYSAPTNNYSAPASNNYSAPDNDYSAPDSYSPPASSYSAPVNNYSAPANNYSAPANNYSAPSSSYSAPSNNYGGSANNYTAPANNYSAPAPASNYSNNYSAPANNNNYGGGAANNYSAPSNSYNAPANNYSAPSNNYNAPSNNYGAPSNNYNAPSNNYRGSTNNYAAPAANNYSPPKSENKPFVPNAGRPAPDTSLDTLLGDLQNQLKAPIDINSPAVNGSCASCHRPILGEVISALGQRYHPEHFVCNNCQMPLGTGSFYEQDGVPNCERCYQELLCPRCAHCDEPILDRCVTALGKKWHMDHFICTQCLSPFHNGTFFERDSRPFCENCFTSAFAPRCGGCNQPIRGECINALGQTWHPEHFVCQYCQRAFNGAFYDFGGKPYCDVHYHQQTGSLCAGCGKAVSGRCVDALGKKWHPEHFVCAFCMNQLAAGSFTENGNKAYCKECHGKLFG